MKAFFARLNSTERRFVIAVMIVIFLVINVLFIWPRFKDWNEMKSRLDNAGDTQILRQKAIQQSESLKPKLVELEKMDVSVPAEDQENEFLRTITTVALKCGVAIQNSTTIRQSATTTNQFFSERAQAVNVIADEPQLVDFLYNLGVGSSLIRVRDLTLNTDAPRFKLVANLKLVASFQKKVAVRTPPPAPAPAKATTPPPKTSPPPPPRVTKTNPPAGRSVPLPPKPSTKKSS